MEPKILLYCLTAWVICLVTSPASSEEYSEKYLTNPFDPIFSESGGGNAADAYSGEHVLDIHPLQQHPVESYTLMGILVSSNWGVAMIRSLSGEEFFVHMGDRLGNNEGVITAIFGSGLEVEEQENIIVLNVKNRSISFETDQT